MDDLVLQKKGIKNFEESVEMAKGTLDLLK